MLRPSLSSTLKHTSNLFAQSALVMICEQCKCVCTHVCMYVCMYVFMKAGNLLHIFDEVILVFYCLRRNKAGSIMKVKWV